MLILYIALGGALGAVARYGLGGWIHAWAGATFPWGTLGVNAAGCLLIGGALQLFEATTASPELRAFATIGLLGAFTTFSTFAYETFAMLEDGEWMPAMLYSLGSVVLGLIAVFAGAQIAAAILRPGG